MSKATVRLCDILGCEKLSARVYPAYMYGEQKDEESYGTWLVTGKIDLCGAHEHQYRTALPTLKLKASVEAKEKRL